jgi:hypothetical protein
MTDRDPIPQLTLEDLNGMTSAQKVTAYREGNLATLMGTPARPQIPTEGQLTRDDLNAMNRTEIHAAIRRGQFAQLLAGKH